MNKIEATTPRPRGSPAAAGSPRFGSIPRATLEAVSKGAESRMKFTATKRVLSDAIGTYQDKLLCLPGDEVTVERWHCSNGPTVIHVRGETFRNTCIPFGWVMEMGAPADLAAYMPFAPHSWEEVLAEVNAESIHPESKP